MESKGLRICIVDDMAQELKEQLNEKIECGFVDPMSLHRFNYYLEKRGINFFKSKYDVLFFDATFEEDGTSTLELLEKLIAGNTDYADISLVLLGTDIVQWAHYSNDVEAMCLIERTQKLPHIIYGNNGTKVDNMVRFIKSVAKKEGKYVEDRLPKGECRPEILQAIKPYLYTASANLKEQSRLSNSISNDLKDFAPISETERQMLKLARELSFLLLECVHSASQVYCGLNAQYHSAGGKLDESDEDSDE